MLQPHYNDRYPYPHTGGQSFPGWQLLLIAKPFWRVELSGVDLKAVIAAMETLLCYPGPVWQGEVGVMHARVHMWRSEDNSWCQSLPSNLFEAESLSFILAHSTPGYSIAFQGILPMAFPIFP